MLVKALFLLTLLFDCSSTLAGDSPPVVLITPLDMSPLTFRSQLVKFDDQFQYGVVHQPLLMLPPDDLNLCTFPTSLDNMTMADAAYMTRDQPIALLIAGEGCPFDRKALVIAEMQERLTPSLRYIVVYGTDSSQSDNLIYVSSNSTLLGMDRVSFMLLSWNSGVVMLEKISNYSNQTGFSSRLLNETSRAWGLRVNLEVVHPEDVAGHGSTEPEHQNMSSVFYILRCVVLPLLCVTPCIRAGYLWYSAGGRILVRRDENGRVTGLQYIHPPPILSPASSDMRGEDRAVTLLTEKQVRALPELVYKRKLIEGHDPLNDGVDEAGACVPVYNAKVKPVLVNNTDGEKTTESVEEAPEKEFTGDMAHPETGDMAHPETADGSSNAVLFTTCTICSICIEEFEDGETIGILPKCNHGFHLECIKPWLTERQSSCPLCKTNVLTPDALKPESDDSQDSPV